MPREFGINILKKHRDIAVLLNFVFGIYQNVLNSAIKKSAKVVKGDCADGLIVFQAIQQASADAKLVDQFIGCNTFLFHRFIKRSIRNHKITSSSVYFILVSLTIVNKLSITVSMLSAKDNVKRHEPLIICKSFCQNAGLL